jgi:hypothetical protein
MMVMQLRVVIDGVEKSMQKLAGVGSQKWCVYGDGVVLCCFCLKA